MVQALVDISDHANQVINIVKAKYGLKDKSQAIERMASEYEEVVLEPPFRPEFIAKVQAARKGPFRKAKSIDDLL